MLNRRLLRIKAMQTIYAYKQSKESNFQLAIDQIKEKYEEKLRFVGRTELESIRKQENVSINYLKENHELGLNVKEETEEVKIANDAIRFYQDQIEKDFRSYKSRMVFETERLYLKYINIIFGLLEFSEVVKDVYDERSKKRADVGLEETLLKRIYENKILQCFKQNLQLQEEVKRYNLEYDMMLLREWYRQLKADKAFVESFSLEKTQSEETDLEVIKYLVKEFLFKNEKIVSDFEEEDLSWAENKTILRSMLLKTFKSADTSNCEHAQLLTISRNWEEDKHFFEQLYIRSLREEKEYEPFIEKHLEKWSKERIAKIDSILLIMALSEMVNFTSIPVKVTINEYIEISKSYSTPKSWQFVNGILDAISKELQDIGKIRKSGRGLIDNK
ncbi:transcription antitermination factor NusB [Rapidithrix thailandica]|uniref:Transcription antitermination factor NusB n=1 Tax=Rapidithrix thailandica TaxID=413964 RepID=A0AAW9S1I1_9BACT